MPGRLPCYGKLFPPLDGRPSGTDAAPAVFGYEFGEPGTVARAREVTVDLAAWDRCLECPDFATCRQLSVAKVLLEIAARD